jgi:hypothetical protein
MEIDNGQFCAEKIYRFPVSQQTVIVSAGLSLVKGLVA